MKLGIAEILTLADEAKTVEEKAEIFLKHFSNQLMSVIKHALDPNIEFLLPEGHINYIINPLLDQQNMLYVEERRLYLFVKGGHPTLTQEKRLKLFQSFLSNLAPEDAELMMHVKDKRLPYPTLTRDVIMQIFPNLLPKE